MQKSRRLGVTLFALSILLILQRPLPANGQGFERVKPLFDVVSSANKSNVGYTPAQIRHGYGFDQISNQGQGQVIAIIVAFDDPNIEDDLRVFNKAYNLPACTTGNGCFNKVPAANPVTTDTATLSIWAFETALDVEWAHAIAPKANILLVESEDDVLDHMLSAVDVALKPKYNVSVVSMSWGGDEFSTEARDEDGHFVAQNVTFFSAAGDFGHGARYPATSPNVMSVGGTTLRLDDAGNYISEKAWSFDASTGFGGGGGQSLYEPEPQYQTAYPIPNDPKHLRGTPDVAYVGNPNTGVAIYDSVPLCFSATDCQSGWEGTGGTSVGPPQWAALVAIANSMRDSRNKKALTGGQGALYDAADDENNDFTDITKGRNGSCGAQCRTKPGYDYVTGLGTPQANNLIPDLRDLQ